MAEDENTRFKILTAGDLGPDWISSVEQFSAANVLTNMTKIDWKRVKWAFGVLGIRGYYELKELVEKPRDDAGEIDCWGTGPCRPPDPPIPSASASADAGAMGGDAGNVLVDEILIFRLYNPSYS